MARDTSLRVYCFLQDWRIIRVCVSLEVDTRDTRDTRWRFRRTPISGDDILGFVTRGGRVSVHRRSCTNAAALLRQEERPVEVSWKPSTDSVFLVAIQVEALDRHRLLSDITRVLSDERVNIISAIVSTMRDRVAISRFTFELGDPMHLGHVLRTIRTVEGVYDVYRVASAS